MIDKKQRLLEKPTIVQNYLTGLATALSDVLFTHPLWTIKTLQQQGMNTRTILQSFSTKPLLAYNGVTSNVLTMIPLTTTRVFLSSELEKWLYHTNDKPSEKSLFLSSFIAGSISSAFGSPTELVRTIALKQATLAMENQHYKATSSNFFHIGYDLVRTQGIRTIGNAVMTVAIRDGLYTSAFFTGAPLLKEKLSPFIENNVLNSLISYSVASTLASLGNHPFDTIKTLQHSATACKYLSIGNEKNDFISVSKKIIEKDGITGFWKGYPPRGLRFLIGLIVKANCIEILNNYWIQYNKAIGKDKVVPK